MARKFNCMYMMPTELTGKAWDLCGIFRDVCPHEESCVGREKHTEVSRKALAEAIEIRRAEREKNSPLTPQSGI